MSIHGIQFLKNIIQVLFRQLKVPEPKTIEAFTITSKLLYTYNCNKSSLKRIL